MMDTGDDAFAVWLLDGVGRRFLSASEAWELFGTHSSNKERTKFCDDTGRSPEEWLDRHREGQYLDNEETYRLLLRALDLVKKTRGDK